MLFVSLQKRKTYTLKPVQLLQLDQVGSRQHKDEEPEQSTQSQKSSQTPQHTCLLSDSPTPAKASTSGVDTQEAVKGRRRSSVQCQTRPERKQIKRVQFSCIHFREHAMAVGDHDWCSGKLPLTLDWQHTSTRTINIEDFEWMRERQGRMPRGRLPSLCLAQRKRRLRRVSGITEEDLLLMEREYIESKYLQLHRSKTVTLFPGLEMEDPEEG